MRTILFLGALCLCLVLEAVQGFAATTLPGEHIPGTSVEMPYLIAPIIVDGKLMSYAYVSSRIIATSPAAAFDVRAKTPFIQDADVRDVNRSPISDDSDPPKIDMRNLTKRLFSNAARIVGDDKVSEVELITVQISQVHPNSQTE